MPGKVHQDIDFVLIDEPCDILRRHPLDISPYICRLCQIPAHIILLAVCIAIDPKPHMICAMKECLTETGHHMTAEIRGNITYTQSVMEGSALVPEGPDLSEITGIATGFPKDEFRRLPCKM